MLAVVLAATACAQPLMKPPEEMAGRADVYLVRGRQGLLILDPAISFGPFRTVSIHRGSDAGEHSSIATGLTSSEEHDSSRQVLTFTLRGPGGEEWRGRCERGSDERSETHVTGLHVGTDGARLTREETPVSSRSGYDCDLAGPSGERWRLEADERLSGGSVRDAAGAPIADVEQTHERWSWQHPELDGNTVVGPHGEVWAAVQRSFDGAVYLSRDLDDHRRSAVAAICTALLIPGPP